MFGATGMVGQGVLRECLRAADVAQVLVIGRTPTGVQHSKLREIIHPDLFDTGDMDHEMQGFDACFYCLGVASFSMTEADYTRITYDLTMAVAQRLSRLNPQMTFVYVTGGGTDSSEQGRTMWARVKGRTENALMRLPFKGVYLFRPGAIQALHGARSKTGAYRCFYTLASPLLAVGHKLAPRWVLTTEVVGLAMLAVARHGAPKPVLESPDINAAAENAAARDRVT
ncbi:MAG: NAD-dependent epimerase/dehydratase family protein [Acetobacteraceae bacterium]